MYGCGWDPLNPFSIFNSSSDDAERYSLTFEATWSSSTHPEQFPENPCFTQLVGATHNSYVIFWNKGEVASRGIETFAKSGENEDLVLEIESETSLGNVQTMILARGINPSPGSTSLEFKVTEEFPYITLISKLMPSPDWFIGVSALSLRENGKWISEKEIELYVWDAGTDSGESYTSQEIETVPKEPILEMGTPPFSTDNSLKPVGKFIIKKL